MTALEAVNAPSCPLCGENRAVGKDRVGGHHVWLCSLCWTVFDGTEDEWRKWTKRREQRASWLRNRQEADA